MESDSPKYPRTPHFPYSPGVTNDDRILPLGVTTLLNRELVATEKMDGSNVCLESDAVFARSHSGPPTHPSFDLLKAYHSGVKYLIDPDLQFFGEWCYAVHSIQYEALPAYFFLFGVRDKLSQNWCDFDNVTTFAAAIGAITPPVLWRGTFATRAALERAVMNSGQEQSTFGGPREGLVVRWAEGYRDEDFDGAIAKWVRAGHVQTDDHWTRQTIVRQRLS